MSLNTDEKYMRMALSIARRGLGRTAPNPSVGCIIVKNDIVIGRGRTADKGRPHAEAAALAHAGVQARGSTAYVTLEPCFHEGREGPCSQALIDAKIARVVVGCIDPNPNVNGQGIEALKSAGIDVISGVLEDDVKDSHQGFFLSITAKRPMVTLKSAVSADGKISKGEGQRTQITGKRAGAYTHLLRSQHDAILIGANTQRVDEPLLTTRIEGYEHESLRVVMDKGLHLSKESLELDARDLSAVMEALSERGVTRLLVEGGATVHTSFLEAGLCDEFYLFRSKAEIGGPGVVALNGHSIFELSKTFDLQLSKTMSLGEDCLEIYQRKL